jgi:aryl-alcohol dehydrogenase-like predicted oxidoreductase
MEFRRLGNSGTVVTLHALGTVTFGAEADEEASFALLDRYREAGGNLLDTADVYSAGASETIIGRWLAARPADRDQMVLASKGRFPTGTGPNDLGSSRRHLARALEASLRRLQREHIDLYQLHAWDPLTPPEETIRFLGDAISAGKIGAWGVSNFTGWQLTKAVHLARELGVPAPLTIQSQYNLLVRGIEAEIIPAAADAGVGLLPWSPLAGGWLSGKYQRDVPPGAATRYGENPSRGIQSWSVRNGSDRTWRVLDAVADLAAARDVPPPQIALAWLAQQHAVTSIVLGARTIQQLESNLLAAEIRLSSAELEALTSASAPEFEEYPYGEPGIEQRSRRLEGGR